MKKIMLLIILLISLSGCSKEITKDGNNAQQEIVYADKDFIKDAAEAYNNRQDAIKNSKEILGEAESVNFVNKLTEDELSKVEVYANLSFEDTILKEKAISYINSLKNMRETFNVDALYNNNEDYTKAHNERGLSLDYFSKNEEYMKLIKEEYRGTLDQLKIQALDDNFKTEMLKKLEDSIRNLKFEKKDDGYGLFDYTSILENSTEATFSNVSVELKLQDKEGVIVDTQHIFIDTFKPKDKYRVEFMTDKEFKLIDFELNNYIEVKK